MSDRQPARLLTGRIDLEFEIDVDIRLCKGISHRCNKAGVGTTELNVDDIALARGFNFSFFFNNSASQTVKSPSPSVASIHCSRIAGLSSMRNSLTTRCATRSLLMISIWVAIYPGVREPGNTIPTRGSGDLTSITTAVKAVYCFGRIRLTTSVGLIRKETQGAHLVAGPKDKQKLWECHRLVRCYLENTFAHINDVVGLHRIRHFR